MAKIYKYGPVAPCYQAVIFARVSSKEQEPGASLDAQIEYMIKYCSNKGLEIINKYRVVESSTRGKRIMFENMMDFVKSQSKKTAIVVYSVDRFQRRFDECKEVRNFLSSDTTEIHFCKEGLILNRRSPSSDIIRWDMGVMAAEMYILAMVDNINRSMDHGWKNGNYQTKAPIGYKNTRDINGRPTIIKDPEKALAVIEMFNKYATGNYSLKSLCEFAKEINLSSNFSKTGASIGRNSIYNILKNTFYYGVMKIRGELIPHVYEPLISKKLFDKVQEIMNEKQIHGKCNEYAKYPFAFRRMIKCAHCGCTISIDPHVSSKGILHNYLRCGKLKGYCNQKLVDEKVIFKQLDEEVFSKIKVNGKILDLLKQEVQKNIIMQSKSNSVFKNKLTVKIHELEEREQRIKNIFFDGGISREEWEEEKLNIFHKKKILEENAKQYADITNNIKDTINNILDIASNASKIIKGADPIQQNRLLKLLLEDCELEDEHLNYKLRKPFDKLIGDINKNHLFDLSKEGVEEICSIKLDIDNYKSNK